VYTKHDRKYKMEISDNMGGGRQDGAPILETIDMLAMRDYPLPYKYVDTNRVGDHICCMSDPRKRRSNFQFRRIHYDIPKILSELVERHIRTAGIEPTPAHQAD
jgi:UDP-glucose 4-epimerase